MPRWLKITLGVIAGIVILLLINALVVSNATKDAYVRDEGAQLVDTSGGKLEVLDRGGNPKGSPIVLIHCYTCSERWWDQLAPLLAPEHRVITLDLLGHGGSDKPDAGYSIDDQANAVAEALSKLGITGATVVGHSLGASVATALAERSPQLAPRVVIIDQAPDDGFKESFTQRVGYWPVFGQAEERLLQVAPKSLIRDQYDDDFAPGYSIPSGFTNPDQPVDDLRAMTYTSFKDTKNAEEDFVDGAPLDQRLAASHTPLLVLFGAEDQLYDPQAALDRYRQVPGAQVHLIPGAGHSPNVEKPDLVAPLILAFAKPPNPRAKKKPPAKKKSGNR
jgi:pimeloyl-ACP methyl ester carboxylesterase